MTRIQHKGHMFHQRHQRLIRSLALLLAALRLASCVSPHPTGLPSTVQVPSSASSATQPTPSLAAPAPIPTLPPTATTLPQPSATPSQMPTLTSRAAATLINDLILSNDDCQLPCWWDIRAGESSWAATRAFLSTFASDISQGNTVIEPFLGQHYVATSYGFKYRLPGSIRGGAQFGVWDDTIMAVLVGSGNTHHLSARALLTQYGKPDQVFIHTISRTPNGSHPAALVISYASKHFIATYYLEANRVGEYLVLCPKQTAPWVSIHAPQLPWSTTDIQDEVTGPDPYKPIRPIAEALDLSLGSFHDLFRDAGEAACISTPATLW